jgi:hypothetical protein
VCSDLQILNLVFEMQATFLNQQFVSSVKLVELSAVYIETKLQVFSQMVQLLLHICFGWARSYHHFHNLNAVSKCTHMAIKVTKGMKIEPA